MVAPKTHQAVYHRRRHQIGNKRIEKLGGKICTKNIPSLAACILSFYKTNERDIVHYRFYNVYLA